MREEFNNMWMYYERRQAKSISTVINHQEDPIKLHKKYSKAYVKRVNLFFLCFCMFKHKLTI
ncbi:hypothetical protein ABE61_09560 [Lysinibacillus sphaericus]|nr:hypothetical protein [Lysinibacillus sphaericus]MBG9591217.1 hypothetical protein [Lysinibacillus sphaericus]